jgi:hypothetical protein
MGKKFAEIVLVRDNEGVSTGFFKDPQKNREKMCFN